MKGFTPTAESHGLARGAPPASRIMIGVHFSHKSQGLMNNFIELRAGKAHFTSELA